MSYKEYKNAWFFAKEWRDDDGNCHREDGPAYIIYYPSGSINIEHFYFKGKFLGEGNIGFWNLWGLITEERRQAPDIIKCLARYS